MLFVVSVIASVMSSFSVVKCKAWVFISQIHWVCECRPPEFTARSIFDTHSMHSLSSCRDLLILIADRLRMHLISSPLRGMIARGLIHESSLFIVQTRDKANRNRAAESFGAAYLCMHFFCACVSMHLCCMCVCVSLVSAAVQECRSESMMANTHHTLNQTNPSSLLSCLKSLSLSHRTINTFASPPNLFSSSFFSVSRRKRMFATSSRLSDVALYFVHSHRPHNSGRWILKHSQGPAREGTGPFWSFNGGVGAK